MSDPTARENADRLRYALDRGHALYTAQAALCERFYLGGGRQWSAEDRAALAQQRRPAYEFNEILPSVNSALGYQIANRLDIAYRPRGMADQKLADLRGKVAMQVADANRLHWKESEVFADGLIMQRGYYDVRVAFDSNMQGSIQIGVLDPMDVVPDPDAKTYEPAGWGDVIVMRWLTLDEIEQNYGRDKRNAVDNYYQGESDFGDGDDTGAPRAKFGDPVNSGLFFGSIYTEGMIKRIRVIDRQRWVRSMSRCLYYPRTGDLKIVENLPPDVVQMQVNQGAIATKALQQRVKWTVSTDDIELHDDWSMYDSFTVVPYFAYFRRGQTIGMVDNAVGPQEALNKGMSQFVHVVNTSANSGWTVEQGSLTNMTLDELEQKGAATGLVLEYAKGSNPPAKIGPNPLPQGVDRLLQLALQSLKSVTVPDAMRGIDGADTSGLARQTQQFAGQQQIAKPLDNLARTRHLLATKISELVTAFYTEPRILRITEQDPLTGADIDTSLEVNQYNAATGAYDNDLTTGDYDAVISEQPTQVTFENSQFNQALELRKVGVAVPDSVMVRHSTLSRKEEVVQQIEQQSGRTDPLNDARAELAKAQTKKTLVEAVLKAVEAMFSATQAGNQIAAVPGVAPLADQLLRSAGFEDQDAAPIVPQPASPTALPAPDSNAAPIAVPQPQANTSPGFPARPAEPDAGLMNGIETPDARYGDPA